MIECVGVSAAYRRRTIIENISFTALDGAVTVIVGKNGSGKSTLFRSIAGVMRYSGSIRVDAHEVCTALPRVRAGLLSMMPQMLARPSVTVRELVSYGRQPYAGFSGRLSQRDWQLVDEALERAGMTAFADAYVNRISGGEVQKAYLAMTMAQATTNILLDEPCAHLDVQYEKKTAAFMKQARAENKCVLAVLHNLNRALEVADRLIVMEKGTVAFSGSPAEFIQCGIAQSLFGLRRYHAVAEDGAETDYFA